MTSLTIESGTIHLAVPKGRTEDAVTTLLADAGIITGSGGPIVVSVFATQNRGSFYELEDAEGRIAEMLLNEWQ